MKVIRYTESLSKPKDTMFVEIDEQHRFTRRGQNWAKFRQDLVEVLKETISDELAEEFEKETADWASAAAP
jgi:hypothetical protein